MATILHTMNKSPFTHSTLANCLSRLNQDDALILLEDGVYAALASHEQAKKIEALTQCYAMQHDLAARGLSTQTLLNNIQLIDDEKFVQLSTEHSLIQSWY